MKETTVVSIQNKIICVVGLLTVDPRRRLRMSTLLCHPWVQGCDVSSTALMTPDVLTTGSSNRSAELGVKHAFNAFHQAHREGFRLQVQFRLIILLLPYKLKLHKSGKQLYRAMCITKKQILEHLR